MTKKTFRVTMCQTIRLINDVHVEAESQEEATALMVERLTEDDWGWYDRSSIVVLEVELCDEEDAA